MFLNITTIFLIIFLCMSSLGYTAEQGVQMKKQNILKEIEISNNWKWITGVGVRELTKYSLPFLKRGEMLHKANGSIFSMSISPDNKRIAFTVYPMSMAGYKELYIMKSDGTNLVKLGEFDLGVVTFTPDNKSLILGKYMTEDKFYRNKSVDFFEFDISSKEKKFLCSLRNVSNYAEQLLSPNGQQLLYVDSMKNIIIYEIKKQRPIEMGIKGYSPAWSPDGQYIAYQGSDGNCYTMKPDGSGKELLWNTRGYKDEINLAWSPDSQYVLAFRWEVGIIRMITAKKDAGEMVYYVIDRNSKIIKGLGSLR